MDPILKDENSFALEYNQDCEQLEIHIPTSIDGYALQKDVGIEWGQTVGHGDHNSDCIFYKDDCDIYGVDTFKKVWMIYWHLLDNGFKLQTGD